MNKFECYCKCENPECSRFHNPPLPPCNCIRQISNSTKFIERILDCTDTIVRVLCICGVHECKAKAASDVIIYAFLHFDIVPDPVYDVLRKKMRKDDLLYDLGRKCRMNYVEAHLVYSIIKKAFKAFYYKQCADMYNPDYIDELQWMRAAQKSAEVYANAEGLSNTDRKKLENKIKCAYCSYIQRVQDLRKKDTETTCSCYFCNKCMTFSGMGYKVFADKLPREDDEAYKFKQRLIEEGQKMACAPQDPCGLKMLERQTLLKALAEAVNRKCTCGKTPCECVNNNEEISVQWTAAPESLYSKSPMDEPSQDPNC